MVMVVVSGSLVVESHVFGRSIAKLLLPREAPWPASTFLILIYPWDFEYIFGGIYTMPLIFFVLYFKFLCRYCICPFNTLSF